MTPAPQSTPPAAPCCPAARARRWILGLGLPLLFGLIAWGAAASFRPARAPDDKKDDDPPRERPDAPELKGGVAWLNTAGPLRLKDLRGKIVLLDFWTLCCIN